MDKDKRKWRWGGIGIILAYLFMLVVNGLANALPINDLTTAEVSKNFPNLFTPAPLAFSIWGLIYGLLFVYVLYSQKQPEDKGAEDKRARWRLSFIFIGTSFLNAGWIFAWHHLKTVLAALLLFSLLALLVGARRQIEKMKLSAREKVFIGAPFSLYFGWITVASIAGTTAMLVSLGWRGGPLSQAPWTSIILLVGLVIGLMTMARFTDWLYGLVFVWAYANILYKQLAPWGHDGAYSLIIGTVSFSLVVLLVALTRTLYKTKSRQLPLDETLKEEEIEDRGK